MGGDRRSTRVVAVCCYLVASLSDWFDPERTCNDLRPRDENVKFRSGSLTAAAR